MTVPTPASDEQLRRITQDATGQWIADTERSFREVWDDQQTLDKQLAAITDEARRTWWTGQLREYARRGAERFHSQVNGRRGELIDQLIALLRQTDPPLNEQEARRPGRQTQELVAGLVPATSTGKALTAALAATEAFMSELIGRAPTLEDLRTGKADGLALAGMESKDLLRRSAAAIATIPQLPLPEFATTLTAQDSAAIAVVRGTLPTGERVTHDAERALSEGTSRLTALPTLEEQHQLVIGAFDTARRNLTASTAKLNLLVTALEKTVTDHRARFDPAKVNFINRMTHFYGDRFLIALASMPPATALEAIYRIDLSFQYDGGTTPEMALRDEFPQDTTPERLSGVLTRVAQSERRDLPTLTSLIQSLALQPDKPHGP
ncbi:hypothetical protein [Streptomyces sp. NPDC050738]|uniref:hypothetical protein n=1 Tax=Streptomyces sp. NPDC050738 TaxID=3154744 RepID=UPI003422C667